MFKLIWDKFLSLIGKKEEPKLTPLDDVPLINIEALRAFREASPSPAPVPTPAPKVDLPKTIADIVKQETPQASEPAKQKKPRKPRMKKVPPNPEILKVYADPKPEPTEKLDSRLDGYVTKPKKPRRQKQDK